MRWALTDLASVGRRMLVWREDRWPGATPFHVYTKAAEELGEVGRALLAGFENRTGRGDLVDEAAQTILVLASLCEQVAPDRDLWDAVLAELDRLERQ